MKNLSLKKRGYRASFVLCTLIVASEFPANNHSSAQAEVMALLTLSEGIVTTSENETISNAQHKEGFEVRPRILIPENHYLFVAEEGRANIICSSNHWLTLQPGKAWKVSQQNCEQGELARRGSFIDMAEGLDTKPLTASPPLTEDCEEERLLMDNAGSPPGGVRSASHAGPTVPWYLKAIALARNGKGSEACEELRALHAVIRPNELWEKMIYERRQEIGCPPIH